MIARPRRGASVAIALAVSALASAGLVEERERLPSSPTERQSFQREFEWGGEYLERRGFLIRMLMVALGALGVAAVFPIRSLGPKPGRSLFRTAWRAGSRVVTEQGQPVAVA